MHIINSPIAVIGAGSWGTALAIHLARNNQIVNLWGNEIAEMEDMKLNRHNSFYLPNITFPDNLKVFTSLDLALENVKQILIAVPSQAFSDVLYQLKPLIDSNIHIIWATKGIDPKSYRLFHNLVQEILNSKSYAVISGPSFAKEVAQGLPTAITITANQPELSKLLVKRFNHQSFRVYTVNDIIGVQLGGAIKNVIAIATGASDGLNYGANAKSALITRGLAEITRLGLAMGAKLETFTGLSGLGDLILTCTDNQSRNRRLGLKIASGISINEAEKEIGQVVEGKHTAKQVVFLAEKYKVDMPISQTVWQVLQGELSIHNAVASLLNRKPKHECS